MTEWQTGQTGAMHAYAHSADTRVERRLREKERWKRKRDRGQKTYACESGTRPPAAVTAAMSAAGGGNDDELALESDMILAVNSKLSHKHTAETVTHNGNIRAHTPSTAQQNKRTQTHTNTTMRSAHTLSPTPTLPFTQSKTLENTHKTHRMVKVRRRRKAHQTKESMKTNL